MNFNYSVHVSFKYYVISKGDPHPPMSPTCHQVGGPPPPSIFDDIIFAQPLTTSPLDHFFLFPFRIFGI